MGALRLLALLALLTPSAAIAAPFPAPQGWRQIETATPYPDLIQALRAAVKAHGMITVTRAGPTRAAKARGITIPGNRVIGVFNNRWAVRMLAASTAAGIEAPIRFYVTETEHGAVLSWKTPSSVFAPYFADADADLRIMAGELDAVFEAIATAATQ